MKRIFVFVAVCILSFSCGRKDTFNLLPASDFETSIDGKEVSLYTLKGGDLTMQVTNFGGRVVT